MATLDQIREFFLSNPSQQEIAAAVAAHPEITTAQIAQAMQVSPVDVKQVLGALPSAPIVNTGVNVASNPHGAEPTGGTSTHAQTSNIPRRLTPDEWAAQHGYTRTEDGRYRSPDGESYVDADQIQQGMMPDYGRTLKDAGYIPVGAGGLTQDTVSWLNNKYGTHFSDPTDYYRYLYGGGSVVNDPATGMQLFRIPEGANADRPIHQPLSYTPSPTWADYAFPAAFAILAGAGMTGMLPGTTSLFGGAGASATTGATASTIQAGGAGAVPWTDPLINQAIAGTYTGLNPATVTGIGAGDALAGTVLAGAGTINPLTGLPFNQFVNLGNTGSVPYVPTGITPGGTVTPGGSVTPGGTVTPGGGTPGGVLPPGTQFPAPVQEGPTTPGPGPGGSQPPISTLPDWLRAILPAGTTTGSLLGNLLTGGLGAYASNQQANAYSDIAREQMTAEQARYNDLVRREAERFGIMTGREDTAIAKNDALRAGAQAIGAPYRGRLESLYANPSSFLTSPEVQVPVQQGTDIMARALSAREGNPVASGGALQQLQSYASDQLFGKLGDEKKRLADFGGLGSYNAAGASIPGITTTLPTTTTAGSNVGTQAGSQANLASVGANSNIWGSLGTAASNIFNPVQPGLTMAQLQQLLNPQRRSA